MANRNKKFIVFVLGGPGVGKGTLVKGLVDWTAGLSVGISAGELLRKEVLKCENS